MMKPAQDELQAWLALASGGLAARQRARRLLLHFGGPLQVWRAKPADWQEALGGESCEGLQAQFDSMQAAASGVQAWLASSTLHRVMNLGDPEYPAALLQSPDPPLLLHAAGKLDGLSLPMVAVVGSHHATPAGVQVAKRLSAELAVLGVEVVSGLAVGIDAAAHEAALAAAGPGSTIAVVASGLDEVYPRQHRALFDLLVKCGLVVSEHPLKTPALPPHFPQRNRIIAGLACAVVVVEATVRSGSLITARLAAEAGRDVFAVPGHLSSAQAAGCNQLIKAGAGLLEQVADIVESQPWAFSPEICRTLLPPKRRRQGCERATSQAPLPTVDGGLPASSWSCACRLLQAKPCGLNELAQAVAEPASAVSRTLLMAELQGWVARLPGGLYQWRGQP
jgi:DNA processing protein